MSTALARTDNRHPMQMQLDIMAGDDESLDVSFMSRAFCLAGMPLRKQYQRDKLTRKTLEPQREITTFSRSDEQFALTISGSEVTLPGDDGRGLPVLLQTGVPYGAKARLLILWMTTQARLNPSSRWLEIGKIDTFLEEIGVQPHPEASASVKDQLVRLTFSLFTMVLKDQQQRHYFQRDMLISSSVFPEEDLSHYAAGELAKVRFPLGIELSQVAHDRFSSNDSIPISTESLRKISSSALAIDIYLYLCYRLPLLSHGESQLLTWKKLIKLFGNNEKQSKFRQTFDSSITKALDAYQGANVDLTDEGLLLRYSDPAVLRKLFVANPQRKTVQGPQRVRNRIAPPPEAVIPPRPPGKQLILGV